MGEKGEGFTETIIKNTWTITRGEWILGKEVRRGGRKGQKTILEHQ